MRELTEEAITSMSSKELRELVQDIWGISTSYTIGYEQIIKVVDFCLNHTGMYVVKNLVIGYSENRNSAVITLDGEELKKLQNYEITSLSDDLALIKYKDYYGVVDMQGKILIEPKFTDIVMSKGYLLTTLSTKKGISTKEGIEILEPTMRDILSIEGTKYWCITNGRGWGVIDSSCKILVSMEYDDVKYLGEIDAESYFWVLKGKTVKLYSESRGVVQTKEYDIIRKISEEYFWVSTNHKQGLINKNGEEVLLCGYKSIKAIEVCDFNKDEGIFDPNYLVVSKDSMFSGVLKGVYHKGRLIIPIKYTKIKKNKDYFICYKNKKVGVLDLNGKEVLPFEYLKIEAILETGLIVASNEKGMLIIPPKESNNPIKVYDKVHIAEERVKKYKTDIVDGVRVVSINERYIYVDVPLIVELGGLKGIVDTRGNEITPVVYKNISRLYKNTNREHGTIEDIHIKEYIIVEDTHCFKLLNKQGEVELDGYSNIDTKFAHDNILFFKTSKGIEWGYYRDEDSLLIKFRLDGKTLKRIENNKVTKTMELRGDKLYILAQDTEVKGIKIEENKVYYDRKCNINVYTKDNLIESLGIFAHKDMWEVWEVELKGTYKKDNYCIKAGVVKVNKKKEWEER